MKSTRKPKDEWGFGGHDHHKVLVPNYLDTQVSGYPVAWNPDICKHHLTGSTRVAGYPGYLRPAKHMAYTWQGIYQGPSRQTPQKQEGGTPKNRLQTLNVTVQDTKPRYKRDIHPRRLKKPILNRSQLIRDQEGRNHLIFRDQFPDEIVGLQKRPMQH